MTLLYTDELLLEHQTGAGHPERPERLSHTLKHLEGTNLLAQCQRGKWKALDANALASVHIQDHVQAVRAFIDRGGGRIEVDTVVSARSWDAATAAAGMAVAASDAVLTGPIRRALCLVRPPGHHATSDRPMGF